MKFGILGAGSWGTALGILWSRYDHEIQLWARDEAHVKDMVATKQNNRYLPNMPFPQKCQAISDLEEVVATNDLLCLAVPVQAYRSFLNRIKPLIRPSHQLVLLSKGIELQSLMLPHQIVQDCLGESFRKRTFALSGPSFAKEVAQDKPTTVVLAGHRSKLLVQLQETFNCPSFRTYRNHDLVGVELGGALKNVIAIAAGMVRGLDLGHNTMAGLITRGLSEIARMGVALGAKRQTFSGLSGMGDLILTCNGDLSRNLRVGMALAKGKTLEDILKELGMVAEGVKTSQAANELAQKHFVEMPIAYCVYKIIHENLDPLFALQQLMSRKLKSELESSIL